MKFFYTLFLSLLMCTSALAQSELTISGAPTVETRSSGAKWYTFVIDNAPNPSQNKLIIKATQFTSGKDLKYGTLTCGNMNDFIITIFGGNVNSGVALTITGGETGSAIDINHCKIECSNIGANQYYFTYNTLGGGAPDPAEFTATKVEKAENNSYFTLSLTDEGDNDVYLELATSTWVGHFEEDKIYAQSYSKIKTAATSNPATIKDLSLDIVEVPGLGVLKIDGEATLANDQVVTFHGVETLAIVGKEASYCDAYDSEGTTGYSIKFSNETLDVNVDITGIAENEFDGYHYSLSNCDLNWTFIMDETDNYWDFTQLEIDLAGNPKGIWEIHGTGVITPTANPGSYNINVKFDYVNLPSSEEFTISKAGYSTYYNATRAIKLPVGLEAYVVSYNSGTSINFELAYSAGDQIAADVPVILKGTADQTYTIEFAESGLDPLDPSINKQNSLVGAATDMDAEQMAVAFSNDNFYHYALSLNAASELESVGLYWVADEGAAFEIKAGQAYFVVTKAQVDADPSAARGFAFADATGIHSINAEAQATTTYNVAGQLVREAKGLVVRQGQMMFVK